jgi:hypothetical protein
MNNKEFVDTIESFYKEALEILKKKNADYANSQDPFKNFKFSSLVDIGVDKAILVRILDKLARINNLIDKGTNEVEDETVLDTIVDSINYLAILGAWLKPRISNNAVAINPVKFSKNREIQLRDG